MNRVEVSMIPGGLHPEIHVSKGDNRTIPIVLDEAFTSTDVITLHAWLPDNTYQSVEIEHTSGNTLDLVISEPISSVVGTGLAKINIKNQSATKSISSEMIVIVVEDL